MKDDIYNFIEWHKLNLDIRSDLITVIENIRPGANIELWKLRKAESKNFSTQKKYLEFCLRRFGLNHNDYQADYYISKDINWLNKLWEKRIRTGEFLGYPKCCISAFELGCHKIVSGESQSGPAVEFYRKVTDAMNQGIFDMTLLYVQHIPCGIACIESLEMATKIKSILEYKDRQSAYNLAKSNENLIYFFHYYYPNNIGLE